jgi:hypothetical protein
LQVQVSPQVQFGPQVQGWHEQRVLEHSLVISFLLANPVIRTVQD